MMHCRKNIKLRTIMFAIIGVVVDPCSAHLKTLGQNKRTECIRAVNNVHHQMAVRYLT